MPLQTVIFGTWIGRSPASNGGAKSDWNSAKGNMGKGQSLIRRNLKGSEYMNYGLTMPILLVGAMIAGAILAAPNFSPEARRLERIHSLCEQVVPADAGGGLSGP